MKAKPVNTPPERGVDPDDAPLLTDAFFTEATWTIGERVVSANEGQAAASAVLRRGRPKGSVKAVLKVPTTIRFDADILAALKSSGRGWQTRVNDAMREWIKAHPSHS
ncbi:MAG: BrnA antitoxin family protein [Sideroxydans sp.]|nr:BrnA antitoxin family protein [Sideroxydans sp.]